MLSITKEKPLFWGITEIVPHKEFFDYEAKYEGASEEITPARLDEETRYKVEKSQNMPMNLWE